MGFLLSEHGESEDKHHNYAQEEYAGENICTFGENAGGMWGLPF